MHPLGNNVGSPLRINLVLGHQLPFPPSQGGGVNNLLWMLARQFTRLGHVVSACSPISNGLASEEIDNHGIHHRRYHGAGMRTGAWANNLSGLPYSYRVWRNLPTGDVTSFHAPFSFLLRHRRGLGVCTHTIHRTPKWIVRLYAGMDRIYAGSHATVNEAAAISPRLASRLKAIHNCIELNETPPSVTPVPGRALSLIYVGRFTPDKGLCSLIGGGIDAIRTGCNLKITTLGPQRDEHGGDSAFFNAMNRMVSEAGLSERFEFMAGVNDRARLFAKIDESDVFCLPSLSGETFSMAGLEAMSRAKPLLTSDYGPMSEMVADGITGLTVKAGDRGAWAEAIVRLNKDRARLPEMGIASWTKARREFSVEAIANEYIADFRILISSQRECDE